MQLQRSLGDIQQQGLGLAAISYDSPDVLRAFSERQQITFPLLSDPGSKTIDAWGIRNREAAGRTAGIPYPGTYVIDRSGVIVSRAFENAYQERETAASILGVLSGSPPVTGTGVTEVAGEHLKVKLSASDRTAAPGHRVRLMLDVTPGRNVHVYAPGQQGYLPIGLELDASADFRRGAVTFPPSREYLFAPLNERVQVFDGPFRIVQDVTLSLTPALRQRATAGETLTIKGRLEYQACDDKVCFPPDTVPVTWSMVLTPIQR